MSKAIALNEEQKKLVEENLKLVPYFLKGLYIMPSEYDEMLSAGNFGLIKAAMTYEPSRDNKFATYAQICIKNEFYMVTRKVQKKSKEVSFENLLSGKKEKSEDLSLGDIILVDSVDITKGIEERESIEKILETILNMDTLRYVDKEIVLYSLGGINHKEIGKRVSYTQSYISRIIKKSLKKIGEHINQELKYDKVIKAKISPMKYEISITLKNEEDCKLMYRLLMEKVTNTEDIPDYIVSYRGDLLTVCVSADIESLITIAEILQKAEPYICKKGEKIYSCEDKKDNKKKKQNMEIYRFMQSRGTFTIKEIANQFPDREYNQIVAFMQYMMRHDFIKRIKHGKYKVNKQ